MVDFLAVPDTSLNKFHKMKGCLFTMVLTTCSSRPGFVWLLSELSVTKNADAAFRENEYVLSYRLSYFRISRCL